MARDSFADICDICKASTGGLVGSPYVHVARCFGHLRGFLDQSFNTGVEKSQEVMLDDMFRMVSHPYGRPETV